MICVSVLLGLVLQPGLQAHAVQPVLSPVHSLATDTQGRLWKISVSEGRLWVAVSDDAGHHFSPPVAVTTAAMHIMASHAARPQIVVARDGPVYVSWIEHLQPSAAGQVWFSRSLDDGKSFMPPQRVHQERAGINHRDSVLAVAADGAITIAWQESRDAVAANASAHSTAGAAIYYAVSRDQGQHFSGEQLLAENVDECSHLAITTRADGTVALMWSQLFDGGEHDHAMAEIRAGQPSARVRASYSHSTVNTCPADRAALVEGQGFGYHLAYVAAGDKPGLRITRMDGEAWVTAPARRVGEASRHAGSPTLASLGDKVWLAWREHVAGHTAIWAMDSLDGGKTWRIPHALLQSHGPLDAPQWLMIHGQIYMAVHSMETGLSLVAVSP